MVVAATPTTSSSPLPLNRVTPVTPAPAAVHGLQRPRRHFPVGLLPVPLALRSSSSPSTSSPPSLSSLPHLEKPADSQTEINKKTGKALASSEEQFEFGQPLDVDLEPVSRVDPVASENV